MSPTQKPAPRSGRGMTAKEAAAYLGVAVTTLAKHRQKGTGPKFSTAFGRDARYHLDDLDAFLWGDGLASNSTEAQHMRRKRASLSGAAR